MLVLLLYARFVGAGVVVGGAGGVGAGGDAAGGGAAVVLLLLLVLVVLLVAVLVLVAVLMLVVLLLLLVLVLVVLLELVVVVVVVVMVVLVLVVVMVVVVVLLLVLILLATGDSSSDILHYPIAPPAAILSLLQSLLNAWSYLGMLVVVQATVFMEKVALSFFLFLVMHFYPLFFLFLKLLVCSMPNMASVFMSVGGLSKHFYQGLWLANLF